MAKAKRKWIGWHLIWQDKRLTHRDRRKVRLGQWISIDGRPLLCRNGLHASKRLIDAIYYHGGPILCRVELAGEIVRGDDKACATRRKVIAWIDARAEARKFFGGLSAQRRRAMAAWLGREPIFGFEISDLVALKHCRGRSAALERHFLNVFRRLARKKRKAKA